MSTYISQLHANILDRIEAAAKRSGRTAADICLTAVSKQQPDNRIKDMLAITHSGGQTVFGENKVQEAQGRWGAKEQGSFADARANIQLRMIGPLQTNKAVAARELFDVIETLDREKLAKALVKAMDKTGRQPELFVQVNTGEEPQKAGIAPHDLDGFIKTLRTVYDLHPVGLMCIPPAGTLISGQAPGPHFALLAKLAARNGIQSLSMGMSGDFEIAIEFGATHIRVGSALFGARD